MQSLREFANQNSNLVRVRESETYPGLYVVKYHNKVFYKNLWTPELREMRGLVIDKDWNVVIRPFTKVFNRFENGTDIPLDEEVTVVRKVNGFMAAATLTDNHGVVYSTTGSLDSDFAKVAAEHIKMGDTFQFEKGYTYLFEIVDSNDPHIIDELAGAYLIGIRDLETGDMFTEAQLDVEASSMQYMRPAWNTMRFSEVVNYVKKVRHEGFMVYSRDTALKIKSPYYLTKKLFARIRGDKLQNPVFWTADPRMQLEEEYYPLANHIRENIDWFVSLDEQARLRFMESFLEG